MENAQGWPRFTTAAPANVGPTCEQDLIRAMTADSLAATVSNRNDPNENSDLLHRTHESWRYLIDRLFWEYKRTFENSNRAHIFAVNLFA